MFKFFKNYGGNDFLPLFDEEKGKYVNYEIDIHDFASLTLKYRYCLFSLSNYEKFIKVPSGLVCSIMFRLYALPDNADSSDVPSYLVIEVYKNE